MEKEIIDCKVSEYTGRAIIAFKLGNIEKAKRAEKMVLILYRLQSRAASNESLAAFEALRATARAMKKAEESGISFPFGEMQIKKLQTAIDAAKDELISVGRSMAVVLDLWQRAGATLSDLCNLCNRDYEQVLKEACKMNDQGDEFSRLVFIHNLDYKNPRDTGWLEETVDAPFTHAIKEYMLDVMLNTKEGRAASHEAMEAVFPEIMENAMTMITDADGARHLIDKDGVEVGTVEEE
ncbi:MAG: hypothetical protein VB096_05930 [Pseudoflavonifractor sp.]|nr:hypothetical protein [Pseudoflavonifractor sp.]